MSLSRGGGDAAVVREFDLKTKAFVKDGFALPEAKAEADYIDDDTVLFATDFGPGSLTASGYARIVKIVAARRAGRRRPRTIYEGRHEDVLVAPIVFHGPDGNVPLIVRAVTLLPDANISMCATTARP